MTSKSGFPRRPIKVAYKAVTSFAPGYYQETVQNMLPEMADQLQPFWADFVASGGSEFGDYLAKRSDEVSRGAARGHRPQGGRLRATAIVRAYKRGARRRQQEHQAALPNLGAMVQKYA